jgi:Circularly permutated YpsA SLOG family
MKLLSGGQSGVDRAVLDAAIERGMDYGGWCPKGGWAEDMTTPPGLLATYPNLRETPLADPAQRTEWNIRDAKACMIVIEAAGVAVSKGTTLAQDLAHRYRKPLLIAPLGGEETIRDAGLWLRFQDRRVGAGLTLAIGGPRESEVPGIYQHALAFIRDLFR